MTDKEKLTEIIAEIERLKGIAVFQLDNCKVDRSAWSQQVEVCKKLLSFIGSMPDERPEPISPADVGFEALGRFWDKEAKKDSDELTHSVTKTSDQEPEEYNGFLGEQIRYIDNEIQRLEKLKENPASGDIEKEITDYFKSRWKPDKDADLWKESGVAFEPDKLVEFARHFANWQKQQLMKDAIACTVYQNEIEGFEFDGVSICRDGITLDETKFKAGDEVKVIIIKED